MAPPDCARQSRMVHCDRVRCAPCTPIAPDVWPCRMTRVRLTSPPMMESALSAAGEPTRLTSITQSESVRSPPLTFSHPRRRTREICTRGAPSAIVARSGSVVIAARTAVPGSPMILTCGAYAFQWQTPSRHHKRGCGEGNKVRAKGVSRFAHLARRRISVEEGIGRVEPGCASLIGGGGEGGGGEGSGTEGGGDGGGGDGGEGGADGKASHAEAAINEKRPTGQTPHCVAP
eukprot:2240744-Prymnesium_polylepis.1